MEVKELLLDVGQSLEINADIGDVYKQLIYRLGTGNRAPNGDPLDLTLEEWAGGRWFRDRGEGVQHLWGHVQVIKPPVLLELIGPMFMSYPAINHVEAKLEKGDSGGTILTLRHRAVGMIDPVHRENVTKGWTLLLDSVKADLEPAEAAGA